MDDRFGPAKMNTDPERKGWGKTVLVTVGMVAVLTALIGWAGFHRVAASFSDVGWGGALVLFALYAASQLLRVARYRVMFGGEPTRPRWADLCAVVSLHQMGNHVLPARMGELTFPYLLRRSSGTPVERSLSMLVVVRLQEIAVLGGLFVGAWAIVGADASNRAGGSAVGLLVAGAVVTALALGIEFALPRVFAAFARWLSRPEAGLRRWLPPKMGERADGLLSRLAVEAARPLPLGRRLALTALTLVLWLSMFLLFCVLMRMSGYPVTYFQTIIGSSFANFSQLLPVNTFGSLGSLEAGWTLGFSLVHVPAKGALATAVTLHVLVLGFLVVTAVPAWIWLRVRRDR